MNGQNTNQDLRGIGTYGSASTSTVGDNSPIAMEVDKENTANVQNGLAVKEPAEIPQRAPIENETNLLVLNELMQRALQLEAEYEKLQAYFAQLEKEAKDFEEEFTDIASQSKKNRIWPMVDKCAIFILSLIIFYVFYFYFADFKEDLDYVKD